MLCAIPHSLQKGNGRFKTRTVTRDTTRVLKFLRIACGGPAWLAKPSIQQKIAPTSEQARLCTRMLTWVARFCSDQRGSPYFPSWFEDRLRYGV